MSAKVSEQFGCGAGPQAVKQVVKGEATVLLTGRLGPNAEAAVKAAGLEAVLNVPGSLTVAAAVKKCKSGELKAQ